MFLNKLKKNIFKCFHVLTNLLNHAVSLFVECIKVCLLMGDNSNSLSRSPSLSFYLSLGSLKTAHTFSIRITTQLTAWHRQLCGGTGCCGLWRASRFQVLFPRNM